MTGSCNGTITIVQPTYPDIQFGTTQGSTTWTLIAVGGNTPITFTDTILIGSSLGSGSEVYTNSVTMYPDTSQSFSINRDAEMTNLLNQGLIQPNVEYIISEIISGQFGIQVADRGRASIAPVYPDIQFGVTQGSITWTLIAVGGNTPITFTDTILIGSSLGSGTEVYINNVTMYPDTSQSFSIDKNAEMTNLLNQGLIQTGIEYIISEVISGSFGIQVVERGRAGIY